MQQVAAELQELIRRYFGAVGDSAADEDALVRDASAYQRLVAQLLSGPEACTEEDRDALARAACHLGSQLQAIDARIRASAGPAVSSALLLAASLAVAQTGGAIRGRGCPLPTSSPCSTRCRCLFQGAALGLCSAWRLWTQTRAAR